MRLLNRREFNGLCAALSSLVTSSGVSAFDAATGAASTGTGRTVRFRDGTVVPALGQGSAGLGKGRRPLADEEEALRHGPFARDDADRHGGNVRFRGIHRPRNRRSTQ